MIRAVLWDFGGVILSSPFDAFDHYERAHGPPGDFIRRVNATNPDTNAWARLERDEITPDRFDAPSTHEAQALGPGVAGAACSRCWRATMRPEMVDALVARDRAPATRRPA